MTTSRILPAEWHPQDAILLTWPHIQSAWKPNLDHVEQTYLDLVSKISHYQRLIIQLHPAVDPITLVHRLNAMAADVSNCHFVELVSDDTWARDHGPITVLENGQPVSLNFRFNGWGGKFPADNDNRLTEQMHQRSILSASESIDWVLEGGSIESDGHGSLLTTTACLLNNNRNGPVSRSAMETSLSQWFGCQQVLWLEHGYLEGDDTDAHIDTLARFAPERVIVFQGCKDTADPHYEALAAMKAELEQMTDRDGHPYRLVELPLPLPKYAEDGHRLPATYANFLICNRQVIVPIYDDPSDQEAISIIASVFPDHFVTGVNALPLIEEHGSIHCITMQLPKGSIGENAVFEPISVNS